MKTRNLRIMLAATMVASLALGVCPMRAQDASALNAAPSASVNAPAPQLPYGVSQIVRLAQAKVGDDTIIAYIKNSGDSYGLDANQIIYLREQGLSDTVITTMLMQPKPAAVATPSTPVPSVASTASVAPVANATVAPTVTYVQTVPATTYYYQPYYYQPYYYPAYPIYPAVSLSFGWGWGGYYRGGYGGGHGGGYGGGHGGGWHH